MLFLVICLYLFCHRHVTILNDIRANCSCASLLRTQIRMPRHASSDRAKPKNEQ